MKAAEYYEQFHDRLVSSDEKTSLKAISDLIVSLNKETTAMCKARNVKRNSALVGVLKEVNQKYNAIVSLFEKKDGFSPIIRDGFRLFWHREMPELQRLF